jgi:hypothetical protein
MPVAGSAAEKAPRNAHPDPRTHLVNLYMYRLGYFILLLKISCYYVVKNVDF